MNWNSSLAATAAGSVKKCTNGQTKVIWLPFSGSHNKADLTLKIVLEFSVANLPRQKSEVVVYSLLANRLE